MKIINNKLKSIATLLLAIFAVLMATWVRAAKAESGAQNINQPFSVNVIGNMILALGRDEQLWWRPIGSPSKWQKISAYKDSLPTHVERYVCAADASDFCIADMSNGNATTTVAIALPNIVRYTGGIKAKDIILFPDKNNIYYELTRQDGSQEIHRKSLVEGSDVVAAVIGHQERPFFISMRNNIYIFAGKIGDIIHRVDSIEPESNAIYLFDNSLPVDDGYVSAEEWGIQQPIISGARSLRKFTAYEVNNKLGFRESPILALNTNGPLLDQYNQAIDANHDILGTVTYPDGSHYISVLCKADDGVGREHPLVKIDTEATAVNILGSTAGRGFILESHSLGHDDDYKYISLIGGAPGYDRRLCRDTFYKISDIGINVEYNAQNFYVESYSASSKSGGHINYQILIPRDVPIKHVLIDVYGANGLRRDFPFYHSGTQQLLRATGTAIAFPIVRGDGDAGFRNAIASEEPNRVNAVDDVASVSADIIKRFPSLEAKPIVRGMSAGGWLAMRSALDHPDLFSGAIGYAGTYLFKNENYFNHLYNFFAVSDDLRDLASVENACSKVQLRLVHAEDDMVAPYSQALKFYQFLKAHGCNVELVTFSHGGHHIEIDGGDYQGARRLLNAYFQP